ncbi:MAG: glycoside hydrolase family 95-like protein, partial [Terriglobia bacterium]
MTTLNEMLLQSHDGVIRIFPAIPDRWQDASFKLRAVGAFLVTAERQAGEVQPVAIESLRGRPCKFENPWTNRKVSVRDLSSGRPVSVQENEGTLTFDTQAGSSSLVFRSGDPETPPRALRPRSGPNQNPKEWRGRRLGLPRYF